LRKFSDVSLPGDTDNHEHFYHSFRYPNELESAVRDGLKPNSSGLVFLSKDEIRDRGAGFVIVKVPTGGTKEGRDFVEQGLIYREFTSGRIPPNSIIQAIREVKTGPGNHTTREDILAKYALDHQGSSGPEVKSLPLKYQKWFNLSTHISTHSSPRQLDRYPTIHVRVQRADPTRTTVLRQAFEREMRRRFNKLKAAIRTAIVDRDCFGLTNPAGFRVFFNPCHDEQGKFCSTGGGTGAGGQKWKTSIDEGPPGWTAGNNDITRTDKGMIPPQRIIGIPGERGEHRLFLSSPTGRYSPRDWDKFVQDIKKNGVKEPITIFKEKDGTVHIHEGNHRLRAAIEAGLKLVPVDIRYFGNSQRTGLIVQPDLTTQSPTAHADPEPPTFRSFDFPTTQAKKEAFLKWLKKQEDLDILETMRIPQFGQATEAAWTDVFVKDSYQRGVQRARYEMGKAGYPVPAIGGTEGIVASMSTPFHIERVGVAYSRAFDQLRGITSAMDMQISHVLAQGLADGDNPIPLAKKLLAVIDGQGLGDLGITDSLGRFIPAERRARMLARTEIIRAHALGTLAEAEQWGVAGVTAEVEFVNAGFKVCPICISLQGKYYTIAEARNVIPVHPHCFISPKIPIYTSTGWKPIGEVQIGDLVLTHKGRFRKVYGLPRTPKQTPETIHFSIRGFNNDGVTMTTNHPVLITNSILPPHWKEAGKCTLEDKVVLLATRCKRCDKKIPWFRTYCSGRCCSLDITDRQWADPAHRKNMSEKISKKNKEQYANGERDRFAATKGANQKTREMVADRSWPSLDNFNKYRHLTNTPEHRKSSSERMKKKNPMEMSGIREKATKSLVENYRENPERRLNARMAKHRKSGVMTWIEQRMAQLLDQLGIAYVFQYPILRYDVDFAILGLKIAIECEGEYWHQDKEKDLIRQKRIENEGWVVLRYSGSKINQCLEEIGCEITRVMANHNGQYEFVSYPITKIEKRIVKKPVTLYNLAVEEDESYLAKGMVVHNCRCAWQIVPIEGKVKRPVEVASEDISWNPVMDQEIAEQWAKGSAIKDTMFHGTNFADQIEREGFKLENLGKRMNNGGMMGAGNYVTEADWGAASYGSDVLSLKVNVKKPLDWVHVQGNGINIGEVAPSLDRLRGYYGASYIETLSEWGESYAERLLDRDLMHGHPGTIRDLLKPVLTNVEKYKEIGNGTKWRYSFVEREIYKDLGYDAAVNYSQGKIYELNVFDDKNIVIFKKTPSKDVKYSK
jgi:very-short-patch-repair endonuclease/endogenous inhibitor of DNA gyrase (YacG/DUF329 family)